MPRYVYECIKCAHVYEKLEGWDAKPRQRCPECRSVTQRIPAAPAILFKGSGWYSTDNRGSKWKTRADEDGEESGAGSEGEGDESGSTDGAEKASASKSKASSKKTSKKSDSKSAPAGD